MPAAVDKAYVSFRLAVLYILAITQLEISTYLYTSFSGR